MLTFNNNNNMNGRMSMHSNLRQAFESAHGNKFEDAIFDVIQSMVVPIQRRLRRRQRSGHDELEFESMYKGGGLIQWV